MKVHVFSTKHPRVKDATDEICRLACSAFAALPRDQVIQRLNTYHKIGLAYEEDQLTGFIFLSEHNCGPYRYLGFRMTAVHPEWQKRGIMGHIGVRLFVRRYLAFYTKKALRLRFDDELWFFIRTCNPVPHKALQLGQIVYPNILGGAGDAIPLHVQMHLANLKDLLDIPLLDTSTGVVHNGAVSNGIKSGSSQNARANDWCNAWNAWVPEGSELVMLIPISFSFPFRYGFKLARAAFSTRFFRARNRSV